MSNGVTDRSEEGMTKTRGLWIVVEPVIDLAAVAAALNNRPRKSLGLSAHSSSPSF